MCSKCGEIKSLDNFGNMKSSKDGKRNTCKECRKKHEYEANKDYYIKKQRKYFRENRIKVLSGNYKHKENNKEWYKEYHAKYYQDNKEAIMKRSKEYLYNRIENDVGFKILQRCRTRLYKAVKGQTKSASTKKLIGCSVEHLLSHLENQFDNGMSWDNYGEWHIDHIIPCASFDFTDKKQQFECFNYNNLQPLWAEDNFAKSNKVDWKE